MTPVPTSTSCTALSTGSAPNICGVRDGLGASVEMVTRRNQHTLSDRDEARVLSRALERCLHGWVRCRQGGVGFHASEQS
jgi:hypothetical protein